MTTTQDLPTELPLPPMRLRLMRESDERFSSSAASLARLCVRLGLQPDHELLDVGCSVGRLPIGLAAATSWRGRYVGFDVQRPQIRWARRQLMPASPNLHFRYVDVRNARYNPQGSVEPRDLKFPARDAGFHFATLFSIFTHFYSEDIALYLGELRRCLRPGGTVVATWFLYTDATRERAVDNATYPMRHVLDEHAIYNEASDPLRAIAFHEDHVRDLIAAAGLELVTIEHGTWNGGAGPEFQDVVVLRRPAAEDARTPSPRSLPRRVVGRARREVRRRLGR